MYPVCHDSHFASERRGMMVFSHSFSSDGIHNNGFSFLQRFHDIWQECGLPEVSPESLHFKKCRKE